ncbi:hypothetical protein [Methylobacterium sp. UNC378MF]|uniref:hypothetical protein n=1 Tax=Methylobacterium sp. UNC378MF TaxID=1502748 RepID=UPI00111346FC|nr:hypothetical protein [Methylobacterium sp. UNC378MF]
MYKICPSFGLDDPDAALVPHRNSRREILNMDAFDHARTVRDADEITDTPHEIELQALWRALAADRSARDERTARLRAMRLIGGDGAD